MSRRAPLGAIVFFGLLVASLVCTVLVVRARSPDLMLEVTSLSCALDPDTATEKPARISFFVRQSDDDALVAIVDRYEDVVRTLDQSIALTASQPYSYTWDGRDDDGSRVPAGRYRLRVDLRDSDREMIFPLRIFVDLPPPPGCGQRLEAQD